MLDEVAQGQVQEAWADLIARGPDWVSRAKQGRLALERAAPDLDVEPLLPLGKG